MIETTTQTWSLSHDSFGYNYGRLQSSASYASRENNLLRNGKIPKCRRDLQRHFIDVRGLLLCLRPGGIKRWCCLTSDVCCIHPIGRRRVRPAGCISRIGWSGPARPAWLKVAAARFSCRPGREHNRGGRPPIAF